MLVVEVQVSSVEISFYSLTYIGFVCSSDAHSIFLLISHNRYEHVARRSVPSWTCIKFHFPAANYSTLGRMVFGMVDWWRQSNICPRRMYGSHHAEHFPLYCAICFTFTLSVPFERDNFRKVWIANLGGRLAAGSIIFILVFWSANYSNFADSLVKPHCWIFSKTIQFFRLFYYDQDTLPIFFYMNCKQCTLWIHILVILILL